MIVKHIGKLVVLLSVVIGATACGNAENLEDVPVDGEINSEQPADTAPSENEMVPQEPADGNNNTEMNSEEPANSDIDSEAPAGSELDTEDSSTEEEVK